MIKDHSSLDNQTGYATTTPASSDCLGWSSRTALTCPGLDPLPVAEDHLTQIGSGSYAYCANIRMHADVGLLEQQSPPLTAGFTVMRSGYVGLLVPIEWQGEYRINGQVLSQDSVLITWRPSGFFYRGEGRKFVAVTVPRLPLINTLAALRGVHPDDVDLPDGLLRLQPAAAVRLRSALTALVAGSRQMSADQGMSERIRNRAFAECLEFLLAGASEASRPCGLKRPEHIVRKAEERFTEAGSDPVSLADLCSAAGVSRSALNMAFQQLYGEPPLRYFYRRRLNRARQILTNGDRRKGAIQDAALEAGVTELGRFSRDYRKLFGESPSTTISRDS